MSDDVMSEEHDKSKENSKEEKIEECCCEGKTLEISPSVRKKLRALAFGTHKKSGHCKESSKKKKRDNSWTSKLNSRHKHSISQDLSDSSVGCSSCICTGYKKTAEPPVTDANKKLPCNDSEMGNVVTLNNFESVFQTVSVPSAQASSSASDSNPFSVDDWDELARQERAKEIEEGIDPPPGFQSQATQSDESIPLSEISLALSQTLSVSIAPYRCFERFSEAVRFSQEIFKVWERHLEEGFHIYKVSTAHSQIDYVHCLVPDLLQITNCSFYWGKMDRYEAEKLLDKQPEGMFLLRDSAQEEFLFSVSFRRYERTLHARIEQWNHKFSFDSHDPGVFASNTVCGLIEHYKDPSCCMFFEPMLTLPLNKSFVFPLQHLCRAVICNCLHYDDINELNLPKKLKFYLKEYHYKQRVRVRRFDLEQ